MIRGRLQVIVEPEAEPVSLDEIYSWLRLDPEGSPPTHPDDAMLRSLIRAGRQYVEKATRRALVAQTLKYQIIDQPPYPPASGRFLGYAWPYWESAQPMPNFPGRWGWNRIELFRPPIIAVLSVASLDDDGNPIVMDPASYRVVDAGTQPGFIESLGNAAWPQSGIVGRGLEITYVAGYEGTGSPPDLTDGVPEDLKTAIKLWVQKVYDPNAADTAKTIDETIDCICQSYMVYSF